MATGTGPPNPPFESPINRHASATTIRKSMILPFTKKRTEYVRLTSLQRIEANLLTWCPCQHFAYLQIGMPDLHCQISREISH